ncbi:MAG: hypothetical protein M0Z50_05715 [Planctomycetia bacterium]|nr:hypothetical protein [Planctomycetia bacterium]
MEYLEDDQSWADKPNLINDFVEAFQDVTDGLEDASPADLERAIHAAKNRISAHHRGLGVLWDNKNIARHRIHLMGGRMGAYLGWPEAPHAIMQLQVTVMLTKNVRLDDYAATLSMYKRALEQAKGDSRG